MTRTTAELSTGELLVQLSGQVTRLVRDEVTLAQHELRAKLDGATPGVKQMSVGAVLGLLGGGTVVAAVVLVLALFLPAWVAALIVGVVLLVLALVFYRSGRSKLRKVGPPVPTETLASLQEDVKVVSEGVRR